ncbi:MAG: hypothetical protein K9L30_12800 [Desulfobacterales bacterium]|nr:hypothetical protein [Desulfobacterales bacterium]
MSQKIENCAERASDLQPLLCIIGRNSLQNELFAMNISNRLKVECRQYKELYIADLPDDKASRKYICFFDYNDFKAEEIERYLGVDKKNQDNIIPTLFNVHPNDNLKQLIRIKKLCAIFFQNESQVEILKDIKSMLNNNFYIKPETFKNKVNAKQLRVASNPSIDAETLTEREKGIMRLL